tara:strand:- start:13901 stop:14809 length:909 start_codon:yes stop_codon:yes gene_type:complete
MNLMPPHLELNCPACGVGFVLDHAFAGSICRCSGCGALVSIHPDAAGNPVADVPRHDDPTQQMTAADIHPTILTEHRAQAGRSVMAYQRDIPPRQIGKRIFQITVVFLVMTCIIIGSVWLVTKRDIKQPPADHIKRTDRSTITTGGDLASHAPLFWGVRLDSPAVILIDATGTSESWLEDAKQEIRKIRDVLQESKVPVTFVFFDGKQIDMPRFESSQPLGEKFDAIKASGALLPADAMSRLSHMHMQRLVLVGSQALTDAQVQAIDKVLTPELRLDVIWQGDLPKGIDEIVARRKGVFVQR